MRALWRISGCSARFQVAALWLLSRVRTFRDGGRLGLTDHEISQLLDQLAEERQQIEQQLATTRSVFVDPATTSADEIERVIQAANLRLQASDENTRAEILDLLDIEVQPTETGYTVHGTIPLDPGTSGNIPAQAPQRLAPLL